MSEPRLATIEASARNLAARIGEQLSPGVGFTLFLYSFGPGGWMTYISSSNREDMRRALGEFLAKEGGVFHEDGCPHNQACTCGQNKET